MDLDFEKEIVELEQKLTELRKQGSPGSDGKNGEAAELERQIEERSRGLYAALTPWQTVQVARHADRPHVRDFIQGMCSDFLELHGDRRYGDDKAMIGGFASIENQRVMIIGTEKGRSVEEKVTSNFGMANPEGYRKALRLMQLAEKYGIPVVSLIDTPAAYPGREAEERGQAEAIARNLTEMAALEVPIVVVITGEGGSGGALGIGLGDVVMMLSYAVYSVIPPEGCAAILWRDSEKAPEAAEALKLTAGSLLELGIIDEIVPEPPGGAHRHSEAVIAATKEAVLRQVRRLRRSSPRRLVERRYDKFAKIGKTDTRRRAAH